MANTNKALDAQLREKWISALTEYFTAQDEEVLRTGTGEIAIPCLDADGNDKFVVVTVKVPMGSRDGEAYDGYGDAQSYQMKCAEKAEKAEKARIAKEKKIKRDAEMRRQRAEAKAKHEAEKKQKGEG